MRQEVAHLPPHSAGPERGTGLSFNECACDVYSPAPGVVRGVLPKPRQRGQHDAVEVRNHAAQVMLALGQCDQVAGDGGGLQRVFARPAAAADGGGLGRVHEYPMRGLSLSA